MESVNETPELNLPKLPMTCEHALLFKTLIALELPFDGSFDRLSLQKIAYFLQASGVGFGLNFSKNLYGPYSETLKKAYVSFEKHGMISGFLNDERQAHVTQAGCAAAEEFLHAHDMSSHEIVRKISMLLQGYESPYGLELLSSVHWLAHEENLTSAESIAQALSEWNDHKRNLFSLEVIKIACDRLYEDGFLPNRVQ